MNFSNLLQYIFNIDEETNIDLHILHRLKKEGYMYLINCWKKIEQMRNNIDKNSESKLDSYFNTYLKIYLIENDLHKGVHEYIERLCNSSNKEIYNISLQFFYKFITNLEYTDLEEFILNVIGIINIMNIKKYTLENLIEFYNIIIKYPKVIEIIVKSPKWKLNSAFDNEYYSYLGKLINKVDILKINWNCNIDKLCNLFVVLLDSPIQSHIYKWFISGIIYNKHKLAVINENEILYSDNLIINIFYILKNKLDQISQTPNFYNSLDISYQDITDEIDTTNISSTIFFLTDWYFQLSLKNIVSDHNTYIKEINYIDGKIEEICKSNWWNTNYKLRIQYISKFKKKRFFYKKKIKSYKKIINNKKLITAYLDYCNIISKSIISNQDILQSDNIIINLLDSLINIRNFVHDYNINQCIDTILYILKNEVSLNVKNKCIEFLVYYISTDGMSYLNYEGFKKQIIPFLIITFNKCETLQDSEFYNRFEPRYHISFFIRYITNYLYYTDELKNYLQNNLDIQELFLFNLVGDISELFYEILHNFDKIKILNNQKINECTIDDEDNYIKIMKLLETFTTFISENILLLSFLLHNIINIENLNNTIFDKLHENIIYILRKISINIEEYNLLISNNNINFDITKCSIKLINLITYLLKSNYFEKLLISENNSTNNLFNNLISKLFNNKINSWSAYYNLYFLNQKLKENQEIEKEIPSKYLDPILDTIIKTPVILPESNIFIDLNTIKKHLETSNDDPFNRTPLTIDDITTYNNRDDIKIKIQTFINESQQYY